MNTKPFNGSYIHGGQIGIQVEKSCNESQRREESKQKTFQEKEVGAIYIYYIYTCGKLYFFKSIYEMMRAGDLLHALLAVATTSRKTVLGRENKPRVDMISRRLNYIIRQRLNYRTLYQVDFCPKIARLRSVRRRISRKTENIGKPVLSPNFMFPLYTVYWWLALCNLNDWAEHS